MAGDVTGRCPRTVAAQWGQGPPGSGRPGAGAVREGGAARADASLAVAPQKRAAAGSASTEPRASPDTRRRPSASGSGPGVFPAPPGAGGPPPPARAPPPAMQAIRRRRVRTAVGGTCQPRTRPGGRCAAAGSATSGGEGSVAPRTPLPGQAPAAVPVPLLPGAAREVGSRGLLLAAARSGQKRLTSPAELSRRGLMRGAPWTQTPQGNEGQQWP